MRVRDLSIYPLEGITGVTLRHFGELLSFSEGFRRVDSETMVNAGRLACREKQRFNSGTPVLKGNRFGAPLTCVMGILRQQSAKQRERIRYRGISALEDGPR